MHSLHSSLVSIWTFTYLRKNSLCVTRALKGQKCQIYIHRFLTSELKIEEKVNMNCYTLMPSAY